MKRIQNMIFLGILALACLACLVRTFAMPIAINEYENRYAEQVAPLRVSSYLSGEFQDQMELALGDQVLGAIPARRLYNNTSARLLNQMMQIALRTEKAPAPPETGIETQPPETDPSTGLDDPTPVEPLPQPPEDTLTETLPSFPDGRYYKLADGTLVWRDHLCFSYVSNINDYHWHLDAYAGMVNSFVQAYPDVDFYFYYIEKETDLDLATGAKTEIPAYFFPLMQLPENHKSAFVVNSFDDLDRYFFKTDHHWNCVGSYAGYRQVLSMLLPEETPLEPLGAYTIGLTHGSKATGSAGSAFYEKFTAYQFDFPAMQYTVCGNASSGYGAQESYLQAAQSGEPLTEPLTYGQFYGGDWAEVIFRRSEPTGNGNLLVVGESFDNAILRLLASHYDTLCSVDMRYYESVMQKPFSFADYQQEHAITDVLFIGNFDYPMSEVFWLR